jgi:hypothetical protein
MKIPIFLILIFISASQCNLEQDGNNIEAAKSKQKLLYLETIPEDISGYSMGYSQVILYDLISGNELILTDNKYILTSADFFPDGEHILITSAREGNKTLLDVQGLNAPLNFFKIDIGMRKLEKFLNLPEDILTPGLANLHFLNDNYVFFTNLNSLCFLYQLENNINYEITINGILAIDKLSLNSNDSIVAFTTLPEIGSEREYRLIIYNIKNQSYYTLYKSQNPIINGNWDNGRLYFIAENGLHEYNVSEDRTNTLPLSVLDSMAISEFILIQNHKLFFIAKKLTHMKALDNNIYFLDMKAGDFKQLTQNKSRKENLRIFYKDFN